VSLNGAVNWQVYVSSVLGNMGGVILTGDNQIASANVSTTNPTWSGVVCSMDFRGVRSPANGLRHDRPGEVF